MYPYIGIDYQSAADIDAGVIDMIRLQQERNGLDDKNHLVLKDKRNGKTQHWIKVPKATTDGSFRKNCSWFGKAIEAMGNSVDDTFKSAKRLAKHLKRKYRDAFEEFLEEEGHCKVPQMSAER